MRLEETILRNVNQSLLLVVNKTLEIVVEYCIKQEFDSYFFYLFESADSSPAEDAASRLVAYLDGLLIELKAVRTGMALNAC